MEEWKMRRVFTILLFCNVAVLCAYAEDDTSPMYYWSYDTYTKLNGKSFYSSKAETFGLSNATFADSYCEQDGYALVAGIKTHFWLYDTISYHGGDASAIYNRVIPNWVERLGYVIDFDNIEVSVTPNILASIKALMNQRGCDIAICIFGKGDDYAILSIQEYLSKTKKYKHTSYPLYK